MSNICQFEDKDILHPTCPGSNPITFDDVIGKHSCVVCLSKPKTSGHYCSDCHYLVRTGKRVASTPAVEAAQVTTCEVIGCEHPRVTERILSHLTPVQTLLAFRVGRSDQD